jgi:hypothetical protein
MTSKYSADAVSVKQFYLAQVQVAVLEMLSAKRNYFQIHHFWEYTKIYPLQIFFCFSSIFKIREEYNKFLS